MPQAVVHVLVVIILLDIIRDFVFKNKKAIPLHYIFIGGVAGLLPDIDIPVFWVLKHLFNLPVEWFHRTFTHGIFFPLIFLVLALMFIVLKKKKIALFFSVITFGTAMHLLLDATLAGTVMLLYPYSATAYGFSWLSTIGVDALLPGLDALLLISWLFYIEWRHKISDFI